MCHRGTVLQAFPSDEVETLHDFEMTATRRPKILVQTAGHVAGAAYYYQRKDVDPDAWNSKQVIYYSTHTNACNISHAHAYRKILL